MSNANMIVKGENSYSDLTDQELNPHIQYVERPMMAPLEPWMAAASAPPPHPSTSQQSQYYSPNENGSFLPTPPGSTHPSRQSQQLHQLPQPSQQQNAFPSHEFMSNNSNVPLNYQHSHQHPHQVYSPSPSPPRYRQGSIASDSSNPSSTPYADLEDHPSQSSRNHAGGGGGTTGGTKMTVNKRDKALERNRQAALRCRQRKKEWLNQLQSNVDVLTKENRALEQQSLTLREEILNLKTILLAHRDCSHAHLTASSINFDTLLYRPAGNPNTVGANTSSSSTTAI
ncbi:basic-leucine zipper transcription factor [Mucor lusitanicus CBS 277.49]|uniref:Basic-leucine zipper transcription factor n=2 Tax=Mucor circinelloides f. lusitanicus TaxID=29924 RepID=A0A162ZTR0_MUCCL|nr:basic-leucine zipper transcription factor [Mucor lusitanicus CBS 277.49]